MKSRKDKHQLSASASLFPLIYSL